MAGLNLSGFVVLIFCASSLPGNSLDLPWYSPLYQRRPDTLPRQVKWFPGLAAVGVVAEPNTRPDVALDTDGAPIADRSVYRREARQTVDGLYGNTYTITALGNGIHTLTWRQKPGTFAIGNSTFIVGDHDVIVVDTGFSRSTGRAILEGLKTVTDKPVSMVINTHWHADHVFGNQVFRSAFPAARFVAHPATREGIITGEVEFRDANRPKRLARIDELKAKATRTDAETRELREAEMQIEAWQGDYVLPDLLVDQKLTIMQGKRLVHILHLGDANTKGDLVIHLPAERVAISGDMAITPMQFAFFSSPRKWIETLGRLAAIDAVTIVPGHGPPQTDRRFIADLQAMLRSVVEQVDAGIKAGQDLEALKAGVKVVPPAGSIYGKASNAALDTLFRIPAIESAFKEKG